MPHNWESIGIKLAYIYPGFTDATNKNDITVSENCQEGGGRMNMCTALEELKNEGKIIGFIEASKGFGATREEVEKKIRETYGLDSEEAAAYMEKYW